MGNNNLLWFLLVVVGFLFLISAGFMGSKDEGEKRINLHKGLGLLGTILILIGLLVPVITNNVKLNTPYFYFGIFSIVMIVLAIIGGVVYTKADKAKKLPLRKSHRFDAIIAIILALVTIIFGFFAPKLF